MDDDLKDTAPMNTRSDYFASGSNQTHWFLIDQDKEVHMVEMVGLNGSYEAFWTAEVLARTFTDKRSLSFQPR